MGTIATRPAAPSGLSAQVASLYQIDLSWTNNTHLEQGVEIERSANGGDFELIGWAEGAATGFSDIDVRPGTSYSYRIMACGFGSHSDYAGPHGALDTGEPVDLSITAASGPFTEGAVFGIGLSASGIQPRKWLIDWGDGTTQVLAGTATYAEHIYVQDGSYAVKASVTEGDLTFWSNQVPAYILNAAPSATITSSDTVLAGSAYTLYFDEVADPGADALTWRINWGDGSSSNGIDGRVAWSASHVYAAQGRYRIEATLSDGTTADDVVLVHYAGALPAPTNVVAEATGEESIQVTWQYGAGAVDGFLIEVSEDGSQYDLVDSVSAGTRQYLIEDLDCDTSYHVRVTAFHDQDTAGAGNTATTWAGTLAAPTNLQGDYGGEYLTLAWDEGAAELGYQVQIRCGEYGHPLGGQEWLEAAGAGFGDEFGHWVWHGYAQHPGAENELRVRAASGNSFSAWATVPVEVGGPGDMPGDVGGVSGERGGDERRDVRLERRGRRDGLRPELRDGKRHAHAVFDPLVGHQPRG